MHNKLMNMKLESFKSSQDDLLARYKAEVIKNLELMKEIKQLKKELNELKESSSR